MSAYIVTNKTIEKILCAANWTDLSPAILGIDINENRLELAQSLLDLNIDAVQQRYPNIPQDKITFVFSDTGLYHVSCKLVVTYDSLCELLYQCSEGNVPDTKLYHALIKLKSYIADKIIRGLPEYKAIN